MAAFARTAHGRPTTSKKDRRTDRMTDFPVRRGPLSTVAQGLRPGRAAAKKLEFRAAWGQDNGVRGLYGLYGVSDGGRPRDPDDDGLPLDVCGPRALPEQAPAR